MNYRSDAPTLAVRIRMSNFSAQLSVLSRFCLSFLFNGGICVRRVVVLRLRELLRGLEINRVLFCPFVAWFLFHLSLLCFLGSFGRVPPTLPEIGSPVESDAGSSSGLTRNVHRVREKLCRS